MLRCGGTDIRIDPLESGTYDLVHCRLLLMHMRDPCDPKLNDERESGSYTACARFTGAAARQRPGRRTGDSPVDQ
jgi:hypothetical protein